MPFIESGSVVYYQFDSLQQFGVLHAVFTRIGGVSPSPWDSLNLGWKVGDTPSNVLQNHKIALSVLGCAVDSLFEVSQVHSNNVIIADGGTKDPDIKPEGDAVLTNQPEMVLLMRFADCVPIVLYAPSKNIYGLIHAGWRGTVKKVTEYAVKTMKNTYGVTSDEIVACIGPSITVQKYEVRAEVIDGIMYAFPSDFHAMIYKKNGKSYLDLERANYLMLEHAGIKKIETISSDTASDKKLWYSHREEQGKTGRFGVMVKTK